MNQASCDPSLVSIIAAFGTPIIALLVGGFGGLIAYRQWRKARNRLKFDLFDRRLQIYEETRNLLATRMAKGFLQVDTIIESSVKVRVARWLFNAAIADYLREIASKAGEIEAIHGELGEALDEARRKTLVTQQRTRKEWLMWGSGAQESPFDPRIDTCHSEYDARMYILSPDDRPSPVGLPQVINGNPMPVRANMAGFLLDTLGASLKQ